jgi:NAD-dependent deacetylase
MKDDLEKARQVIGSCERVVVLTGSGISAESGVPTFRGADGLWKNFRAEELATPEAFIRDPKTVWEWYDWRRSLIKQLKPNAAHFSLVELESKVEDFVIITQNVDGLHEMAGSENILELHGNIWKVKCTLCDYIDYNYDVPITIPPQCPECEGLLRPGVVWFGEPLNENILDEATELLRDTELTIVVGTSALVQPAAGMAMLAKSHGSKIIEINLDRTPNYGIDDFFFQGKAGEILPKLIKE